MGVAMQLLLTTVFLVIFVVFLQCLSLGLSMLLFMMILVKLLGLVVMIFVGLVLFMPFPLPPHPLGRLLAAGQDWWVGSSQGSQQLPLSLHVWRFRGGGDRTPRRSVATFLPGCRGHTSPLPPRSWPGVELLRSSGAWRRALAAHRTLEVIFLWTVVSLSSTMLVLAILAVVFLSAAAVFPAMKMAIPSAVIGMSSRRPWMPATGSQAVVSSASSFRKLLL